MMNAEEIKNMIWDLTDCLHGLIFSPDRLSGSVVRLVFLKYAVDNGIGAADVESMQCCARAQKMFARRDTESGLETLIPVLQNIDRTYRLDHIISSDVLIEQYAGELFGMDRSRQKRNVTDQGFRRVMDRLCSYDLEEVSGSHELGRALVDGLISSLSNMDMMGKIVGEQTTNPSLARLAKSILNVTEYDTFCDFVSGRGLSTIEITGDTLPSVALADVNCEAAATSAMMLIMYGYTHFSVTCGNSLLERLPDMGGNRIFVDPPVGMRLEKASDNQYSDSTLATIDRVMHDYLTHDGVAVVTTPSSPLFRQGPAYGIKNEIITLGCLHAVIALPPMWNGSNIGTNLLVLKKTPTWDILFVDASDRAMTPSEKRRGRAASVLSDETIREIAEIVHNPHDVPGFGKLVRGTDIDPKEYNLVPANYVRKQAEEETATLAEIDKELDSLYRQLNL